MLIPKISLRGKSERKIWYSENRPLSSLTATICAASFLTSNSAGSSETVGIFACVEHDDERKKKNRPHEKSTLRARQLSFSILIFHRSISADRNISRTNRRRL